MRGKEQKRKRIEGWGMCSKVILIPGNGCDSLDDCMWYPWLRDILVAHGVKMDLRAFPDPLYAHEEVWKEFAVNTLKLDENTIVVGHSSGAACALRLMEEHPMKGCVLLAAYDSDLGDELERESGYFSRPFDYAAMMKNVSGPIIQLHSKNDPLVPYAIGQRVSKGLQTASKLAGRPEAYSFVMFESDGHFQRNEMPQLFSLMQKHFADIFHS